MAPIVHNIGPTSNQYLELLANHPIHSPYLDFDRQTKRHTPTSKSTKPTKLSSNLCGYTCTNTDMIPMSFLDKGGFKSDIIQDCLSQANRGTTSTHIMHHNQPWMRTLYCSFNLILLALKPINTNTYIP